ncbi:16344_t:CDS:2 [Funneliformis mosseae]|uniref:16344_t:CDS:1 n=1 Tax=Funneliformis mosseae TaxID=27381 RepID=A0A9N9CE49_FUNMO|nr:16344_t:CDS:2 [Funneliformis mosseae]
MNNIINPKWTTLYKKIQIFSEEYTIIVPNISQLLIQDIRMIHSLLIDLHKVLSIVAKLNEKAIFDSLLEHPCNTIILDRYINNNSFDKELLTDPKNIQNETARHFQRVVES